MTTSLILVLCAITIFIVYNSVAIAKFGIPKSLSDTFYYYQGIKKGLGYIFTAMMFSMAGLLMPGWLTISDSMPGWEHNFTFLAFFAAGAIAFVGAAPAFKNIGIERKVHMIAAKSAAVFDVRIRKLCVDPAGQCRAAWIGILYDTVPDSAV